MKIAALLAMAALPIAAQRKPGSQLDKLPSNIELVTHFGERADISPDNKRIFGITSIHCHSSRAMRKRLRTVAR